MEQKVVTGNFRGCQVGKFVIPEGEDEDREYPKVPGVYLQGDVWLVNLNFKYKRKRISCGKGIEGYRKAVKLREEFKKEKEKHIIKGMFSKNG